MITTATYSSHINKSDAMMPSDLKSVLNTYETSNRKLENFLYVHDIFHKGWYKNPADGLTVWVYEDTDELRKVVAEYMEIAMKRAAKRRGVFDTPVADSRYLS